MAMMTRLSSMVCTMLVAILLLSQSTVIHAAYICNTHGSGESAWGESCKHDTYVGSIEKINYLSVEVLTSFFFVYSVFVIIYSYFFIFIFSFPPPSLSHPPIISLM